MMKVSSAEGEMIEKYETAYLKLWIDQGILFCEYADHLEMDLNIAKLCVESRVEFSKGISYPVCIRVKKIKSIDKQARQYLANEGTALVKAGALIIGSPVTKILGNIFLQIDKPSVPTRLFTNEEEGIEWLKKFD
jgi:hypothetical protein